MTSTLTRAKVINPYIRHGVVATPFKTEGGPSPEDENEYSSGLTFEQAGILGDYFRGKLNADPLLQYRDSLEHTASAKGFKLGPIDKSPIRDKTQLTPNFDFPWFTLWKDGVKFRYHESLTCCIGYSKPKLWTSLDLREAPGEGLYRDAGILFEEFVRPRMDEFQAYYRGVVSDLAKEHEAFQSVGDDDILFERQRRVTIFSFSTDCRLDKLVHAPPPTAARFLDRLARKDDERQELFESFLNFSAEKAECAKEDFGLHVSTNFPMEMNKETNTLDRATAEDGTLLAPRAALVFSIAFKEDELIDEYYFSLGHEPGDNPFLSKYGNSAITSRGLMMEIGRAF